jgi:hypothetical protein
LLQHRSRRTSRLALLAAVSAGAVIALPSTAGAQTRTADECPDDAAKISSPSYKVKHLNGDPTQTITKLRIVGPGGTLIAHPALRKGDQVVVSFDLRPGLRGQARLVRDVPLDLGRAACRSRAQRLAATTDTGLSLTTARRPPQRFPTRLTVKIFGGRPAPRPRRRATRSARTSRPHENNGANSPGPYDPDLRRLAVR